MLRRIAAVLRDWLQRRDRGGVWVRLSYGEALDRVSILGVKRERFSADKRPAAEQMFSEELARFAQAVPLWFPLNFFYEALLKLNRDLWSCEDLIRNCTEANIPALTKRVHELNAGRHRLKCDVDSAMGSEYREIKQYRGESE